MASGKIKFSTKGLQEILCSPGADEVCRSHAVRIMNSAIARSGCDDYEIHGEKATVFKLRRAEWWVKTTSRRAAKAEAENKALTGSI